MNVAHKPDTRKHCFFRKANFIHIASLSSWVDVRFTFSEKTILHLDTCRSIIFGLCTLFVISSFLIAISSYRLDPIAVIAKGKTFSTEWKITKVSAWYEVRIEFVADSLYSSTVMSRMWQRNFHRDTRIPSFARRCQGIVKVHAHVVWYISAREKLRRIFDLQTMIAVSP